MVIRKQLVAALGIVLLASLRAMAANPSGCAPENQANCDNAASAGICNTGGNTACASCSSCSGGKACCNDPANVDGILKDCGGPMNEFAESWFGQCHEICWTATADGIILHRTPAGHQELLGDPVSGAVIWSASDLDYDYSGGPRVSIRGIDCEGYGLEIVYYGIQGWANEANVPNSALPNSIGILVIDKNSVAPVSSAHLSQASKLQNGEANFRVPLFGKFSGLIGFRTIQLSDTYTADAVSSNTFTAFNQTIKTHNFLYGLQVGADGNLFQSEDGDWKLNAFVKAGAFFNWANQQSHLSDPGGLGQLGVSIDGGQGSFLGETGVVLTRQVTKHLAARAGYEALWITGLAQPTQQISQTDITGRTLSAIDTATPVFYHGATVGLELSW